MSFQGTLRAARIQSRRLYSRSFRTAKLLECLMSIATASMISTLPTKNILGRLFGLSRGYCRLPSFLTTSQLSQSSFDLRPYRPSAVTTIVGQNDEAIFVLQITGNHCSIPGPAASVTNYL